LVWLYQIKYWFYGRFDNLKQAKKHFPELNPYQGSKNFTWTMKGVTNTGELCIRFETHKTEKRMSA
jgi:hypothetical protein